MGRRNPRRVLTTMLQHGQRVIDPRIDRLTACDANNPTHDHTSWEEGGEATLLGAISQPSVIGPRRSSQMKRSKGVYLSEKLLQMNRRNTDNHSCTRALDD